MADENVKQQDKVKCVLCKKSKAVSKFYNWGSAGGKRTITRPRCKDCAKALNAAYRKAHPEKMREYTMKYRTKKAKAAKSEKVAA